MILMGNHLTLAADDRGLMGSWERSTGILPVFVYHCTSETPVLLSFALMLRIKSVCPERDPTKRRDAKSAERIAEEKAIAQSGRAAVSAAEAGRLKNV
jgi:hypothetical protein